jgi:nucleotide-binding universal stress UspA family protein
MRRRAEMFHNILLPLDRTDRHQQALDIAAELASRSEGTITLLHVIELIAGLSLEEEKHFYHRLERAARRHLDRWGEGLEKRKIPWRSEVRYGDRAAESIRHARETAADLIILTAPQIDPANPGTSWGSTSYKIGILSQCPVLLMK